MLRLGASCAYVAKELGITRQAVAAWGPWGGTERGISYLSPEQKSCLARLLVKGAAGNGFSDDCWSIKRVVRLIEREFKVEYSVGGARYLIRGMGFRPTWAPIRRD